MIKVTNKAGIPKWQQRALLWLHIAVLAGSIALITFISYDTFRNVSFLENQRYLDVQFWICMLFMVDIVVEFFITPRRWHYVVTHIFFFLIAIPYINILDYYSVPISGEMMYSLRFIPMLRAAYVLAIITGALTTSNRVSSMFIAYISLLLTIVYFASMMFFVEEHNVNPDCTSYAQALWWAIMCMTTAGSYIGEYTVTAKILSVILSGGGLILFPVFTVYITHAVAGTPDSDKINHPQSPAESDSQPATAAIDS